MNEVDTNAKVIWDYMLMHHELRPMEAIFALGTHDTTVAECAASLYLKGYGKYLIFAGESGAKHSGVRTFDKPEAEVFAEIALKKGVPEDKIIKETTSTNTGENILFVRELLKARGLSLTSFMLVQKPYMERRAYATFKKRWPNADCIVTSPQISYEDYKALADRNGKDLVGALVGDLQRIKEYPAKGFQIAQDIPDAVWRAFEYLVTQGFTRRLIKS